jgi:hypothetical protein
MDRIGYACACTFDQDHPRTATNRLRYHRKWQNLSAGLSTEAANEVAPPSQPEFPIDPFLFLPIFPGKLGNCSRCSIALINQ